VAVLAFVEERADRRTAVVERRLDFDLGIFQTSEQIGYVVQDSKLYSLQADPLTTGHEAVVVLRMRNDP
jgi:hypothetical protein